MGEGDVKIDVVSDVTVEKTMSGLLSVEVSCLSVCLSVNYLKESESVPESIGSTLKSAFQLLPPLPNQSTMNQRKISPLKISFHTHESYSIACAPRLPTVKLVTCSPMSPLIEMQKGYDLDRERRRIMARSNTVFW